MPPPRTPASDLGRRRRQLSDTHGSVGVALGLALFSGDLAMRALAGQPLFRMAAPLGGSTLILAWLALAVSAFTGENRFG